MRRGQVQAHSFALRFLRLCLQAVTMFTPLLVSCTATAQPASIPLTKTTALDGRQVALPRDLATVTVLILGFGRKSVEPTTAWQKQVRGSLQHPPEIDYFDVAMLAEVPGFARGWVVRLIRSKVPDIVKPNFLTLTSDENAWKQVAGFDAHLPDAPYVMLVDRSGAVRWSTHELYTPELFAEMSARARSLAEELR